LGRPASSEPASAGIGMITVPLLGSNAAAPTRLFPKPKTTEYGSGPDCESVTRSAIVGLPAATFVVSSVTFGGLRSFTHERRTYEPVRDLCVNGSRWESTET